MSLPRRGIRGVGTGADTPDDEALFRAALERGARLFDSAPRWRHMGVQRALGRAVAAFLAAGGDREELCLCGRAGWLAFDGALPADPKSWLIKEYVSPGLVERDDLVGLAHAIRPAFLGRQLDQMLACLGLERLDLLLLEDLEVQRAEFEEAAFEERMRATIGWLERQAEAGRIGAWGIAASSGLRAPPDALHHLDPDAIAGWAGDVAGADHHFGFVLDSGGTPPTLYDSAGLTGTPLAELEML